MRRKASLFIFVYLLLLAAGCNSKPEAAQSGAPAQSSSSQPMAANTANASAAQNEQKPEANNAGASAAAKIDVCSLIKSEELQAIQGEAIKETKPSVHANGSFIISHCLYMLPTFSKSLSLELTQRDPSKTEAVDLKKIWEERFGKAEGERDKGREKDRKGEREKEREREKKEGAQEGGDKVRGEEEEESEAQRVEGIGEEAFWVGNRVLGALYIFSKNSILRLSLGGPEDEAAKIKKLKVLAQKAIERL